MTGIPRDATGYMGDERQAVVDLVANDWRGDDDWERFVQACIDVTADDSTVDPNDVRDALTNAHGLTINPRRLSAFWNRARSSGLLVMAGWTENRDTAGGNRGKPIRKRRWPAPTTEVTS